MNALIIFQIGNVLLTIPKDNMIFIDYQIYNLLINIILISVREKIRKYTIVKYPQLKFITFLYSPLINILIIMSKHMLPI